MSGDVVAEASVVDPVHEHIAWDLAERGWNVTDAYLEPASIAGLVSGSRALLQAGAFRPAGVGRGDALKLRPEVRSDQVLWLDPAGQDGAQAGYLAKLETLRQSINRYLQLGLFDFEGHLAVYQPGNYYRKHLDQFQGVGLRTVTCILYLNQDWQQEDGGQLRIYTDPDAPDHYEEVLPLGGRLVTFLSAGFPHEVLQARRERFSVTGWFKRRGDVC